MLIGDLNIVQNVFKKSHYQTHMSVIIKNFGSEDILESVKSDSVGHHFPWLHIAVDILSAAPYHSLANCIVRDHCFLA